MEEIERGKKTRLLLSSRRVSMEHRPLMVEVIAIARRRREEIRGKKHTGGLGSQKKRNGGKKGKCQYV